MPESKNNPGGLSEEEKARLASVRTRAIETEYASAKIKDKVVPQAPQPPQLPAASETQPPIVLSSGKRGLTREKLLSGFVGAIVGGVFGWLTRDAGKDSFGQSSASPASRLPTLFTATEQATPALTPRPTVTPLSRELGFSPFRNLEITKEVKGKETTLSLERERGLNYKLDVKPDSELMKVLQEEMPVNKIAAVHLAVLPQLNIGQEAVYEGTNLRNLRLSNSDLLPLADNLAVQFDFINRRTADDFFIFTMIYLQTKDGPKPLNLSELSEQQREQINRRLSVQTVKQLYHQTYPTGVTDAFITSAAQKVGLSSNFPPSVVLL